MVEDLEQRRQILLDFGFTAEFIAKFEQSNPALLPIDTIEGKVTGLKNRGFKDLIKMITSSPVILTYGLENIDTKIAGLQQRGFTDPVKMITTFPSILSHGFENIDAKIAGLKKRGFKDPIKMITSSPAILGYGFENIDAKIADLKERGFADPVKMITSSPVILSYGLENIDTKIAGLQQRGFTDPVKMITSSPTILGLGFENVDEKLKMLNDLVSLYGLDFTAVEVIEKNLSILGTKIDKLWTLARIIRETATTPGEVTSVLINRLLFANLEDIILASRSQDHMTIQRVLAEAKRIKAEDRPKEDKRADIAELSEGDKVKKRYLRGYPLK